MFKDFCFLRFTKFTPQDHHIFSFTICWSIPFLSKM
jgi:hypothetical protein